MCKPISQRWTVELDGETLEGEFALAAVCNGRYYGGGSTPQPQARMDDGVLNTILIRKIDRLTFGRLFGRYSAGRFVYLPATGRGVHRPGHPHPLRREPSPCQRGRRVLHAPEIQLRLAEKRVNFFGPAGCNCNQTAKSARMAPITAFTKNFITFPRYPLYKRRVLY